MRSRSADDVLGLGAAWPRPGWAVLDAARDQAFTGAIELQTSPAVRVHLDRGRVYIAERVTDPPLGARLVDAGALSASELEHGVVRLGDIEHLGRLFERVPSVDRHRVSVVLELMTDEAARWVATQLVRGVVVTPYEYHPSGVHHWCSERDGAVADVRPAALPAPVPGTAHVLVPEPVDVDELAEDVRIEWADAAWMGSDRVERRAVRSLPLHGDLDGDAAPTEPPVAPANAEPPEPLGDALGDAPGDAAPPILDDEVAVAFVAAAADEVVDGFEVIWPTGEVQREFPAPVVEPEPVVEQVPLTWNIRMPLPSSEPSPDVVDELSEEVAAAVRRAIESITSGAVTTSPIVETAPGDAAPEAQEGTRIVRSSTLSDEEASAARRLAEPGIDPLLPGTTPRSATAPATAGPPTAPAISPAISSTISPTISPAISPTISPAPFGAPWLADAAPAGVARTGVEERRSALRRLISGLRRR